MSEGGLELDTRLYFGKLSVLLLESNALESDIVAQVLGGFKVRSLNRFTSAIEAQNQMKRDPADLVIVGHASEETGSFAFIRWLRHATSDVTRTCPIILLTAHTLQSNVMQARDCGANFVIAKPVTPQVMYERILWLGRDERPFISTPSYCGPDRRFQKLGPPPGTNGRRHDDLSLDVGEATLPNMSQQEIDAMLNFKKGRDVNRGRGQPGTARLAALMHQPGGLTADEAVRAATANLEGIRIHAVNELAGFVRDLLGVGSACLTTEDPVSRSAMLQQIYRQSNTIIGVAAPFGFKGLGVVAYSLCELVDRLNSTGQWSGAALRVHLDGVRLMHETPQDEREVAAMQSALREMVGRIGTAA